MNVILKKDLIISAYSIHLGGGRVLLLQLLEAISEELQTLCFIDSRLHIPIKYNKTNISFIKVHPSIYQRFKAEGLIQKKTNEYKVLLCFGNLPPLFKPYCATTVFVQNKYLITKRWFRLDNPKTMFRILIERMWFRFKKSYQYEYVIQTKTMRKAIATCLGKDYNIKVKGFFDLPDISCSPKEQSKENQIKRFIYVASDIPHKNHKNLIEAFKILNNENIKLQLILILLSKCDKKLLKWINKEKETHGLNIEVVKEIDHEEILHLYRKCDALVYPSFFESFGLPLLEAASLGLPIIASERDYVRDLVNPVESFSPESPESISRAIKRFLDIDSRNTLHSSKEFLQELLS